MMLYVYVMIYLFKVGVRFEFKNERREEKGKEF